MLDRVFELVGFSFPLFSEDSEKTLIRSAAPWLLGPSTVCGGFWKGWLLVGLTSVGEEERAPA